MGSCVILIIVGSLKILLFYAALTAFATLIFSSCCYISPITPLMPVKSDFNLRSVAFLGIGTYLISLSLFGA